MKLTPQQRGKLGWLIIALVSLIVSITLGVTYPLPPTARAPQGEPIVELGTTHFSGLNVTGAVDFDDTLNVDGAVTLATANYPLEFAATGYEAVYGTSTITGTEVAAHGLTTVTFALCTLGEVAETGAGDAAAVSLAISSDVVTLATWQDDFAAATETDVVVHWLVVGVP